MKNVGLDVGPSKGYAVAMIATVLAFAATLATWPLLKLTPWAFFFAAVMLSAWYGGGGPSRVATMVAAVLGNVFLFEPYGVFSTDGRAMIATAIFVGVSLFIARLASARRLAVDAERHQERVDESMPRGEPYEFEYRVRRASGGMYRWFLGRSVPIKDSEGRVLKWIGSGVDIHDRKLAAERQTLATSLSSRLLDEDDLQLAIEIGNRAALADDNARLFSQGQEASRRREEALQRHRSVEEQLTLLVEASGSLSESLDLTSVLDAVLVLSTRLVAADAYAVWRYDAATNRWGIAHGAGLLNAYKFASIHVLEETPSMPITSVIAEDVLAIPMLGDREAAYEAEGIRSLLAIPLKVQGAVTGSMAFYYRTPHQVSEVHVRVANALANLAGSAIGTAELYGVLSANDRKNDEFLAILAHELRNPLAAVGNAVAVLRMSDDAEDVKFARDIVERQVKQLSRLIDDLLDVSRINCGKIRLRAEYVDVAEMHGGTVTATSGGTGKGSEFVVRLPTARGGPGHGPSRSERARDRVAHPDRRRQRRHGPGDGATLEANGQPSRNRPRRAGGRRDRAWLPARVHPARYRPARHGRIRGRPPTSTPSPASSPSRLDTCG